MNCPAKSEEVKREICELFYPHGCGTRCNNLYQRWLKDEEEVKKLEVRRRCNMSKSCEKCICYENMIYASDLSDHYCHQGSFWITIILNNRIIVIH